MVPRRYTMWCALSVLAATMGRRIYVDHEHYQLRPSLYITLVGRQGIRKSQAMTSAKIMFTETFPDYPVGASVMSREQIVTRMSKDDSVRVFTDEHGEPVEWRPLAFFINELKNFMSINPAAMVDFLTDIYDTPFFSADTIKHGLQPIVNPFINILACETPHWVVDKLKLNIIAGGFSRRMLYIYETERPERVTFAKKSKEAHIADSWCRAHLQKIVKLAGRFGWTSDGIVFFDKWFRALPTMEDSILEGFYENKDALATKVAMLLAVAQPEPELLLTKPILETGIAFLESIEDNLPKLTIAAGRNELAVPQQQLLQLLENNGGWMIERSWHRLAGKDLNEIEYCYVKRFLKDTGQIIEATVDGKVMILLPAKYEELKQLEKDK